MNVYEKQVMFWLMIIAVCMTLSFLFIAHRYNVAFDELHNISKQFVECDSKLHPGKYAGLNNNVTHVLNFTIGERK